MYWRNEKKSAGFHAGEQEYSDGFRQEEIAYGAKIMRALKRSTGFASCVLFGSEKVSFAGDITAALRVDTARCQTVLLSCPGREVHD